MSNDILDMSDDVSDETFFLNGKEESIQQALDSLDGLLGVIEKDDNFEVGASALRSMYAAGRAVGWSMVKLCYGMHKIWKDSGRDPEQFWGWMQDVTPIKRITIERYINAWDAYLKLNDERLLTRPIKDMVALGSAVAQGYEVDKDSIEKLISAGSPQEFGNELRDIKGQEPRKSALTLYLEKDGTINAWTKDGVTHVGYLDLDTESNPTLEKAVERIVRSAGLIKRT